MLRFGAGAALELGERRGGREHVGVVHAASVGNEACVARRGVLHAGDADDRVVDVVPAAGAVAEVLGGDGEELLNEVVTRGDTASDRVEVVERDGRGPAVLVRDGVRAADVVVGDDDDGSERALAEERTVAVRGQRIAVGVVGRLDALEDLAPGVVAVDLDVVLEEARGLRRLRGDRSSSTR